MTRIKEYSVFAALLLSGISFMLLLQTLNDPVLIAKGLLFAEALIVIGIRDSLTHEIPNRTLLPVLAAGLIKFQPVPAIEGFFAVSLLFLLVSRLTNESIGGGDVKFMAASGFVLGPFGVVGGALIGFLAFYLILPFRQKSREKKESYAMAPWLSSGCFLVYLLTGGIPI